MDRYFMKIAELFGVKFVFFTGNVYFNDADPSDTDHRIAEWTGFNLSLDEVIKLNKEKELLDYINERVDYLGDVTKEEAEETCKTFWAGKPGEELDINTLSKDTPCGYYWFDAA